MSTSPPQKDANKAVDALDLTEQLKASLKNPVSEGRAPRKPAGEPVKDEALQALIREQLEKTAAPRPTGLMDMISAELADFEIEEEPAEAEEELVEVEDAPVEAEEEPAEAEENPAEAEEIFTEDDIPTYDETEDSLEEEVAEEEPPTVYEVFTMPEDAVTATANAVPSTGDVRSADDRLNGSTLTQTLSDALLQDLDEDTRALIHRLREAQVGVSSHEADMAIAETFNHGELEGQMNVFSPVGTAEDLSDFYYPEEISASVPERSVDTASAHRTAPSDPLQVGPEPSETEGTATLPDDYWLIKDKPATVLLTETRYDEGEDATLAPDEPTPRARRGEPSPYRVMDEDDERRRDTELFIRLGYEAEINRVDDATRVDAVKADYIRTVETGRIGTRNTIPAVYCGREYRGQIAETVALEAAYDRTSHMGFVRLWLTVATLLIGLVYDILPLFGGNAALTDFVGSRLYPLVGALLLLAFCAPHATRLLRGVRSLWDFEPVAYAVPAVAVLLSVLHGIVLGCLPDGTRRSVAFVGAALCALLPAVLSDLLTVAAERRSFQVVSSGKRKFVITELTDTPTALDDSASRPSDRRRTGNLLVKKTRHVVDFFMWANRYNRWWGQLNYFIPLALLGALAAASVTVITGGSLLGDGLLMFVTVALCALPASLAVVLTLPLFLANRIIAEQGTTVIGAASSGAYAASPDKRRTVRLIFGDGAALKAVGIKEITVKDDPLADTYRQMAQKVFALLGNPLDNSYADVYRRDLEGLRLDIVEARPAFAKMYLVNTQRREAVEILMGSHAELTALGIRLPDEGMERNYKKSSDSRVVYLAFDGHFRLAYAAAYRVRRSFAVAVHALNRDGYTPVVTTCDPLVQEGIMASDLLRRTPAVTMTRTERYEDIHEGESSGLVATGRATDLAYPLRACRAMERAHRRCTLWQWPILCLTVLCLTPVGAFGHTDWLTGMMPVLWQTLWTAVMALMIAGTVNRRHLSLRPDGRAKPNGKSDAKKTKTAPRRHPKRNKINKRKNHEPK